MKNGETGSTRLKVISCLLITTFCCALFFTPVSFASSTDKDQLDELQEQIDDKESELNAGKKKANALQSEIKALEKQIYSAEVELNSLQKNINATKTLISQTLSELTALEEDIAVQSEGLSTRLRTMYKNGEVGILTVLLGSSDISDFMTNLDMVQRIYDSDADLLESLETQYEVVIDQKIELQTLKSTLLSQQAQESERQDALKSSKTQVQSKKSQVDADNAIL